MTLQDKLKIREYIHSQLPSEIMYKNIRYVLFVSTGKTMFVEYLETIESEGETYYGQNPIFKRNISILIDENVSLNRICDILKEDIPKDVILKDDIQRATNC